MTMFYSKDKVRRWRITSLDDNNLPTKPFLQVGEKTIMVLGGDENCDIQIKDETQSLQR